MRDFVQGGALPSRRRFLLLGAAALALPVFGCATTPNTTPAWVAALQAIATEASSILPQLAAVGLSGAALASAQTIVKEIQAALSAIGVASTVSQGQAVLQQVETYINALAPLVLPFVAAVPGGTIIGLVVAALPAVETALNFVASLLTPVAQQLAASAPPLPASAGFGAPSASQQYMNLLILRGQATRARRLRFRR
jgi:hypothetical protein